MDLSPVPVHPEKRSSSRLYDENRKGQETQGSSLMSAREIGAMSTWMFLSTYLNQWGAFFS
jgi:hypothetical protein